ncbi:MAG: type III-A CRISPR-associated RAMP protein Csm3 [Ruminococcus sp.]|nr:type III-A CRISPR-associated RAMP protein Csm3 [Ruminococcus sp.]
MFDKILITGEIEVITGMHIGAGGEYAAIGDIDSPVVRDTMSGLPIIPGSTLKGKLRSVLVKKYCPNSDDPKKDSDNIKMAFGGDIDNKVKKSSFLFNDALLSNMDELRKYRIDSPTETKYENTINRVTSVANPRQIERVIRGAKFRFDIIYEMTSQEQAKKDFGLLAEGIKLLEYDAIGGHGSRGYGRIKFNSVSAESVLADTDTDELNEILKGV